MFAKIITIITLLALFLLLYFLTTVSVAEAGPGGILLVFLLLYVIFVGCFTALIRWSNWLTTQIRRWAKFVKKSPQQFTLQKSYYFASVVALAPVMLLAIGSVGRLGWYEIGLIVLFVAIGCFYIEKRS
jgi:hypothetical protein